MARKKKQNVVKDVQIQEVETKVEAPTQEVNTSSKLTNNYTNALILPNGVNIAAGKSVAADEKVLNHPTVKNWIELKVLTVG